MLLLIIRNLSKLNVKFMAKNSKPEPSIKDVLNAVNGLDKRFTGLEKQFTDLSDKTDKRFNSVDKRFNSVDKRFDDVDKRFDDVDKRFDDVDKRFTGLDKRIDGIKAGNEEILSAINTYSEENDKHLEKIDRQLTKMIDRDYLDEKNADLRGDLVVIMRKEDVKVKKLVNILQKRRVISAEEVKEILSMEPFPQLSA